jgi:hypothetical protein
MIWPSIDNGIPIVCIDNYYDYHRDFLDRCHTLTDTKIVFQENSCARFICYGGHPKLVISPRDTVLFSYFEHHLNIENELIVLPTETIGSTIQKIIKLPNILERIVKFSNSNREIQIISWASTEEILKLAEHLERHFCLNVKLPESPLISNYWTQQYLDTKSGFREITSTIFNQEDYALPEGFICTTKRDAVNAAQWFLSRNRDCIIKPNTGCLGKGIIKLDGHQNWNTHSITDILHDYKSLFLDELIIVEERVSSPHSISPSIEFYIPPLYDGSPQHTYLVKQCLDDEFTFVGNLISKELRCEPWHDPLMERSYRLAKRVQELGYVGYMDIDCIVDEHHNPYFVEVNPRRTGGTHYHELAIRLFGKEYLEKISLISNSHFHSNLFHTFEDLYEGVRDLLYVPGGSERGILLTEANLLTTYGTVSAASIGKDINEAAHYLSLFQERIG